MGTANQDADASGVATDSSGNVFVTGSTDGGLDGNALTGLEGFLVVKYTSTGARQWTKLLGSSSSHYTWATAIAVTPSGRFYVAGNTDGGLDSNSQTGSLDIFACQYIGN